MTAQENVSTTTTAPKAKVGLLKRISYWFMEVLIGDHAMKVAVGFFAIMLVVLTKVFGPGS